MILNMIITITVILLVVLYFVKSKNKYRIIKICNNFGTHYRVQDLYMPGIPIYYTWSPIFDSIENAKTWIDEKNRNRKCTE